MRLLYADTIRAEATWSFETERFFVGFFAEPEVIDPSDSFEDDESIEFAREGGSHWFSARVSVFLKSGHEWVDLGTDYLGACSYNSFEEFYTAWRTDPDDGRNTLANKDRGIVLCHYFPDMVRSAIDQARRSLKDFADISATMRQA